MITISKAEMLARIVESGEVPFRIRFVKATGKEAGQIAEKVCYYGAPNPHPKGPTQPPHKGGEMTDSSNHGEVGRGKRKSHLESNAIPLTEFATGRMLTPFISHIISYNGKQVVH